MEHEKFTLYPFLCPEHFSSLARVTVNLPQAATATAAGTDVVHRFEHEAQDQVEDKGDGDIEQRDACRRLQAAVLGGSCVCFFSPGKPRTVQVACHKAAVGKVFKALYEQQSALGIRLKPDIKTAVTLKAMEAAVLLEVAAAILGRILQAQGWHALQRGMWLSTDVLAAAPGVQHQTLQACFRLAIPQAAPPASTKLSGVGSLICLEICKAGRMNFKPFSAAHQLGLVNKQQQPPQQQHLNLSHGAAPSAAKAPNAQEQTKKQPGPDQGPEQGPGPQQAQRQPGLHTLEQELELLQAHVFCSKEALRRACRMLFNTPCTVLPWLVTAFIKGIKSGVEDEEMLRKWWRTEAPALELPATLPPLFFEVSQDYNADSGESGVWDVPACCVWHHPGLVSKGLDYGPSSFNQAMEQLRADLTSSSSIRTAFCMWGSGKPLQPAPLLPPGVSDWLLTYDGSKKAEKGGGGTAGASTAVAGPAAAGAEGKGETATQEGAGAAYRSGKPGGSGMTSGAEGAAETATSVAVAEVATAANEDLRVSTPWMVASHSLYGHHTHCGDPLLTSSHQGGMPQQAQQAQQRSTSQVPAIAKRIQGIAQSTSTALQEQAKAAAPNSAVPSAAAAAAAAATTLQKRAQASASLPAIPNATITEHQLDSSQRAQRQSQLAQQRQDGQPFNGQGAASRPAVVDTGGKGNASCNDAPAKPSASTVGSRVFAPSAVGVLLHPVHLHNDGTRGTGSTHGAYWLTAGSSGAISTGGIGALSDDPRMKSILARREESRKRERAINTELSGLLAKVQAKNPAAFGIQASSQPPHSQAQSILMVQPKTAATAGTSRQYREEPAQPKPAGPPVMPVLKRRAPGLAQVPTSKAKKPGSLAGAVAPTGKASKPTAARAGAGAAAKAAKAAPTQGAGAKRKAPVPKAKASTSTATEGAAKPQAAKKQKTGAEGVLKAAPAARLADGAGVAVPAARIAPAARLADGAGFAAGVDAASAAAAAKASSDLAAGGAIFTFGKGGDEAPAAAAPAATPAAPARKRTKAADIDIASVQAKVDACMAANRRLDLTVPEMQCWLRSKKMATGGKKADLEARMAAELGLPTPEAATTAAGQTLATAKLLGGP